MEPSGIEALWERSAAPLPDPEAGQVDRARVFDSLEVAGLSVGKFRA